MLSPMIAPAIPHSIAVIGSNVPVPNIPPIANMMGVAGKSRPITASDSANTTSPMIGPAHARWSAMKTVRPANKSSKTGFPKHGHRRGCRYAPFVKIGVRWQELIKITPMSPSHCDVATTSPLRLGDIFFR